MISPAELAADVLRRLGMTGLEWQVVVGPASDAQQQAGVVSLVAAGLPVVELYSPLQWMRAQIRCLAGTLDEAERIAQSVQGDLHGKQRVIARQASTGERYLVHLANIVSGPSQHFDSLEVWEALLFCELMLGTIPIQAGE